MVYLNEVTDLMDQMMKVEIFQPSEKHRMLRDENKGFLDPNLIMDARHRIFREDLSVSPTKSSVLAEARRLLSEEEATELYLKKEEQFLQKELKKFEKELEKSRPKFSGPYGCSRRSFAPSDDDDFWRTSRKIKEKITKKNNQPSFDSFGKIKEIVKDVPLKPEIARDLKKTELPYTGSIKVTIKDKSNLESEKERLYLLRNCFDALKKNAADEQRLRDIRTRIRENVTFKLTRKYFLIWKNYAKAAKSMAEKEKEERELSDEKKIEMFIDAITEKQRAMMKERKSKSRDGNTIVENPCKTEIKKENIYSKHIIVESPAQSRLKAQKRIIEKQREKLAEQNRIIEELRLKETQKEISNANKVTVNVAKETLTHCTKGTRRTLIQLMRQAGYRDESLIVPQRAPSPPKFLLRMEARAEARKERIKLAEEARRKKFEEQKRKEEAARIEEEQEKKRLQQEAVREARRLREEQERKRLRVLEKFKKLNQMADEFYRKYLLRHYVMEPLMLLVERKNNNVKRADAHFRENLMRKVFKTWREETEKQCSDKIESAVYFFNRKLMSRVFQEWKGVAKEGNVKFQVAKDFYDMKLLDRCFKSWQIITLELKVQYTKKEKIAECHYEGKLKSKYLYAWKKYPKIAADIKESEKRKDELRRLVQKVIPDFDPKHRGVAIED